MWKGNLTYPKPVQSNQGNAGDLGSSAAKNLLDNFALKQLNHFQLCSRNEKSCHLHLTWMSTHPTVLVPNLMSLTKAIQGRSQKRMRASSRSWLPNFRQEKQIKSQHISDLKTIQSTTSKQLGLTKFHSLARRGWLLRITSLNARKPSHCPNHLGHVQRRAPCSLLGTCI